MDKKLITLAPAYFVLCLLLGPCFVEVDFLDIYDTMALFIVKSVLDIYALT
jgi:hypothetical protein